ncbi:MAG: carboxypeptidase-like regulatory domain-containing protein [Saprospiraceae bacterium]|nr:carboxypeptidase-like regulatory domain-containing protein [Saprospiraceae bacterium]
MKKLPIIILLLFSNFCFGQYGSLQGIFVDGDTKEPIPFANIILEASNKQVGGCTSDFEGKFHLNSILPGKYQMKINALTYYMNIVGEIIIYKDSITILYIEAGDQGKCSVKKTNEVIDFSDDSKLDLIIKPDDNKFDNTIKKVEKLNVDGVIIFRFIPDNNFKGYYCSLKSKIIIDSSKFDFIPHNDANYTIIKQNIELERKLGDPSIYLTRSFESNYCLYASHDNQKDKMNCDSIINVFSQYNIYNNILYKLDSKESMVLTISSNSIFSAENSDTIYIPLLFSGEVFKYQNIIYGEQSDYRIMKSDDGTDLFDDSHSICPFEKYSKIFIVLNNVKSLSRINNKQMKNLKLSESKLTELKIFLYE